MDKNIVKSIISEVTGEVTETSFMVLASAAGFPAVALPFAKGFVLGLLENCYNDCAQRTLSVRENKKLNEVSKVALETFWELAEKDCVVAWDMNIAPEHMEAAFEVAEHATLEAIRQSEMKKVDILGRYYGRQFYKGYTNWQDMHQIITMTGSLTFRQLVMIRLISESFKGYDNTLFISNPSACVETNRLKDYGIWQTDGVKLGSDESSPIQLNSLIKTDYSILVNEALMLDKLSEEDIRRTIDSLQLKEEGIIQKTLTEEEFEQRTTWQVEGETLILPDGNKYGKKVGDEQFLFDLSRGK